MQRVVVDADIAGESGGDHVRLLRQIGDRLAVGRTAGAVDRVDGDGLEPELLGGLRQRRAAGALVLDLVAQVADLAPGAALGDLALDLRRDLFIALLRSRLDLADQQQHRAELRP